MAKAPVSRQRSYSRRARPSVSHWRNYSRSARPSTTRWRNYNKRKRWPNMLVPVLTVMACVATALLVFASIPLVSPSLFIALIEKLPVEYQDALFMDFLMRGGTGFWEVLILTVLLWGLRQYLVGRLRFSMRQLWIS